MKAGASAGYVGYTDTETETKEVDGEQQEVSAFHEPSVARLSEE